MTQDFNWLLLADVSSAKARKGQNISGLPDRKWAEVPTTIYDRLADDADRKNQEVASLLPFPRWVGIAHPINLDAIVEGSLNHI